MTPCPECGTPVKPGAKFCLKCGKDLRVASALSPLAPAQDTRAGGSEVLLTPDDSHVRYYDSGRPTRARSVYQERFWRLRPRY